MHPLVVFPQILFLGLLAPFLLRIAVGLFIMFLGKYRYGKTYNWSSAVYVLSGIFLFAGFYTQVSAIVGILVIVFDFYVENEKKSVTTEKKILYAISVVILISLLFTGAGFLALDRPL